MRVSSLKKKILKKNREKKSGKKIYDFFRFFLDFF
jgi:hypothetical protein